MSAALHADGIVGATHTAVRAEVGGYPGEYVENVVDQAGSLGLGVVLNFEVTQLDFLVDAIGAFAADNCVSVVGKSACQFKSRDLDFVGNKSALDVNAVDFVLFAGPFQCLSGRATGAVIRQAVEPGGG